MPPRPAAIGKAIFDEWDDDESADDIEWLGWPSL
jgi:hypothetical protein